VSLCEETVLAKINFKNFNLYLYFKREFIFTL